MTTTVPASTRLGPVDAGGPPAVFGVQLHALWDFYWEPDFVTPNRMLIAHVETLAASGVQVVRIDVGWSASQEERGVLDDHHYYNRRIATVLGMAENHGMAVLLTVQRSPEWARSGTGTSDQATNQYPEDPASIRPWLRWLTQRFGDQVLAIEIWNEPNLSEFTHLKTIGDQVKRYVPVLREAYAAIKSVADVPVVFGGPSKVDDDFLRLCYDAGAGGHFDVLAVHPYQGKHTAPPEDTQPPGKQRMTHLPAVVELMKLRGDGGKPLWATEFGYSVHPNEHDTPRHRLGLPDTETSGAYLVRAFELFRKCHVALGVVYCAYRREPDDVHKNGFSILNADGTPRAQLRKLRSATTR